MTRNETDTTDADERQPLLGDLPRDLRSDISSISSSETKQSLSAGRVFFKICFLLLGDFLANADHGLFIAIYEKVASEFASSDRASWFILATTLVNSVCLPIYGYLGDRYDSKKIILTAYVLMMLGLTTISTSNSFCQVLVGRIIACSGGAGLYSMTAIVIADNANPADVGILRSYAVVAAFVGRNVGPIIGGCLTDALGWRRAFLCEIPVALFCAGVIGWLFDSKKETGSAVDEGLLKEVEEPGQDKAMDFSGLILFAATIISFVFVLKSKSTLLCSAIFLTFGIALFWRQRSIGDKAFIPTCIFSRHLGTQYLLQHFWIMTVFSGFVLIPVYFARVENASSSSIAVHLLPLAGFSTLGNLVGSRLIKITKKYKFITHAGLLFGFAGFFLMGFLWQGHVGVGKTFFIGLLGTAAGFMNASTFLAVTINGDESQKGAVIGFYFLAQELGCLIGTAVSSSLVNSVFSGGLHTNGPDVANRAEIIVAIMRDSEFAFTLPEVWQNLAVNSFIKAWKVYCLVCGLLTIMLQPVVLTVVEKLVI